MTKKPAPKDERGPLIGTYDSLARVITVELPAFGELESQLVDAIRPFTDALIGKIDTADSVQLARSRVVGQAVNDYLDLLYEVFSGRGRPALRSARTLFEHLVNYRWVNGNPAEAQRYCDHGAIGDMLAFELNTPREEEFTGNARRQVRHWRRKLERRVQRAVDAVKKKYPDGLQSRWASKNLRERAQSHDLVGDYDTTYRLLSGVIHGSAGGDLGHRDEIDGRSIVRTGPAVSVCPLALRSGHRYFAMLVADCESAAGSAATARLRSLLEIVDGLLSDHRDVCTSLDASLWPVDPPAMSLLLRVSTSGTWTWFLWDSERDVTIRAEPLDLNNDQLEFIRDLVAAMEAANPGRTKPMVMDAGAYRGAPVSGAPWRPARVTLGPKRGPVRHLQVKSPVRDPSLYD